MIRTRLNHELQIEAILEDLEIVRIVLSRLDGTLRLSYSLGATQQDTLEVIKAVEMIDHLVLGTMKRTGVV